MAVVVLPRQIKFYLFSPLISFLISDGGHAVGNFPSLAITSFRHTQRYAHSWRGNSALISPLLVFPL